MTVPMLDALIGFATVILLLSVLVTALAQATQSILRLRGRNLERGLERLFRQAMIATQKDGGKKPVGLLVVHGMGRQKPGETLESVVRGLRKAYPMARFEARGDQVDMICEHRRVRIYEVHWAPVLSGKRIHGTFSIRSIYEFLWFPQLNNREIGSEHEEAYKEEYVQKWHRKLINLAAFVRAVYLAVTLPFRIAGAIANFALKPFGRKERKPVALVDDWLADFIGDVFNYVNACVGARYEGPGAPKEPPRLAPQRIYVTFRRSLALASRECSEIQILAHSMGTLVVHHALTCFSEETRRHLALNKCETAPGRPHLSHLYTIGTPLEKIRFFWPKVIKLKEMGEVDAEWFNFRSPLDLVAGAMKSFGEDRAEELWKVRKKRVKNFAVRGAGGIVTAHNGYRTHPSFLKEFGPKLTGIPTDVASNRNWVWFSKLRDTTETFVAGFGFILLAAFGATAVFALGSGAVYAILQLVGEDERFAGVYGFAIPAIVGFILAYVSVFSAPRVAKEDAGKIHNKFWRTVSRRRKSLRRARALLRGPVSVVPGAIPRSRIGLRR